MAGGMELARQLSSAGAGWSWRDSCHPRGRDGAGVIRGGATAVIRRAETAVIPDFRWRANVDQRERLIVQAL